MARAFAGSWRWLGLAGPSAPLPGPWGHPLAASVTDGRGDAAIPATPRVVGIVNSGMSLDSMAKKHLVKCLKKPTLLN